MILCIQVCATSPSAPPLSGGASGGSGGGHSGGSDGGSGGTGGGSGTGSSPPAPYDFFSDTRALSNDDIRDLHWTHVTGATSDGRATDIVSNAPLDGGAGQYMTPEGKERVVVERQNYLNQIEGGLWSCNPMDDDTTTTTSVMCEQTATHFELPPGIRQIMGSDNLDGIYPEPATQVTYSSWSEIHDGLTSGRIWDDPTNQTIALAGAIASAPAIYGLGTYGTGAVTALFATPAEAVAQLTVTEQVTAAATSGASLSVMVQKTKEALINVNKLGPADVAELESLLEKVEMRLASAPRDNQIQVLQIMGRYPYSEIASEPDTFLRFINIGLRLTEEEQIRNLLEMEVRLSDLANEDLRAAGLRTLAEQAVGTLSLDNPGLASALLRALPHEISRTLEQLAPVVGEDASSLLDIRFSPQAFGRLRTGVAGVSEINIYVTAIIRAIDLTGHIRTVQILTALPVPVQWQRGLH